MNGKVAAASRSARGLSRDDLLVGLLGRLAGDAAAMTAFSDQTGQTPDGLRQAIADESVQAALMDFLAQDEGLIVGVAETMGRPPEDVADAALRFARRHEADYF